MVILNEVKIFIVNPPTGHFRWYLFRKTIAFYYKFPYILHIFLIFISPISKYADHINII